LRVRWDVAENRDESKFESCLEKLDVIKRQVMGSSSVGTVLDQIMAVNKLLTLKPIGRM
jgi:hypothetical protein